MPVGDVPPLVLRKRSLDARRGRVAFHLLFELGARAPTNLGEPPPREVRGPPRVVVVGDGPAGLFCAYQLAREGVACVVVDRGKQVQPRRRDLKLLNARGGVDPESNYCFGEGGAGTYSDGKLYTRSHKRGNILKSLQWFHHFGATERILQEAHPHIGTNKLPGIIAKMRETIIECGGEVLFNSKVTNILIEGNQFKGVRINDEYNFESEALILATGHSARDIF